MRIINRANGRECALGTAVRLVVGHDSNSELREMVVRLLEELTSDVLQPAMLNATQLSRVLAYGFKVEDI